MDHVTLKMNKWRDIENQRNPRVVFVGLNFVFWFVWIHNCTVSHSEGEVQLTVIHLLLSSVGLAQCCHCSRWNLEDHVTDVKSQKQRGEWWLVVAWPPPLGAWQRNRGPRPRKSQPEFFELEFGRGGRRSTASSPRLHFSSAHRFSVVFQATSST